MTKLSDPILKSIVHELRSKYKCHTVVLYGSRARGLTTPTSDYDVFGVCRRGKKTRVAKKQLGFYWDVFVYPEKDLRKLPAQTVVAWRNAKILYTANDYAQKLMGRIKIFLKKPFRPEPQYEIDSLKVWAEKEFERCLTDDIQGHFRRSEFLAALVEHYFIVRKKKYWGPKSSFAWLKTHDKKTYLLINQALKNPTNLKKLKSAATQVYLLTWVTN